MLLNEILIILITSAASLIVSTVNMVITNRNKQRMQYIESKASEDKAIREQISINAEASRVLLHQALLQECRRAIAQGYISYNDFANINYMYDAYKALHGNGVIAHLYKQVKELPNREE